MEFVAEENGLLTGFVEAGLRSCVDGCDTSRAVGYLEGWYVQPAHRRSGVGAALVAAAEDWARAQDWIEMASDAELEIRAPIAHTRPWDLARPAGP